MITNTVDRPKSTFHLSIYNNNNNDDGIKDNAYAAPGENIPSFEVEK